MDNDKNIYKPASLIFMNIVQYAGRPPSAILQAINAYLSSFPYPDLLYRLRPSQILLTLIYINSYRTKPMHETASIPFHFILQRSPKDLIVFGF